VARFQSVNVDEMARELSRLGQVTAPMAREMVAEGAKVLVGTWKSVIRELKHVDTGDMADSVQADEPAQQGGATVAEIYPRGVDRKGVRNAEKAFLLHYGWQAGKAARGKKKSKGRKDTHTGNHFVDTVEQECADAVDYAMESVMNRYMKGD
jgi:hypothetical protein